MHVFRYRDPTTRGILTAKDFDLFTSSNTPDYDVSSLLSLNLYQEDDSDASLNTADDDAIDGSSSRTDNNSSIKDKDKVKLDICRKFMEDKCSLSTCPLAHPGQRDSCIPRVRIVTDTVGTKFQVSPYLICHLISSLPYHDNDDDDVDNDERDDDDDDVGDDDDDDDDSFVHDNRLMHRFHSYSCVHAATVS